MVCLRFNLGREKKGFSGVSVRLGKRRKRVFGARLGLGKGEKDPRGLLYVWEK